MAEEMEEVRSSAILGNIAVPGYKEEYAQVFRCMRGEHEVGVVLSTGAAEIFGADTDVLGHSVIVKICRHCRCLFAAKP